ncbi:M20/M25/M40 family metallo-hydrolase [Synoicihabitans lomoniglobus]|uniref:M20/M25/M40 family metallo-hydrolase n=1 Tax=Synoicihabitans lomoniglobus TaxID=2909285 RepID=A0AAF0CRR5_9BACT|nr:M20/M25/M40 family metallo-hydrolase [Opitutaceae bacterium LMO-M01]WED66875.1 M20/M25/M40 family metallo-hydrolase [Opitutaceae bacterium LMO-M01]
MFDPVEKLKEFIRHPSVSADSAFADGMKGAQSFVSELLQSIGFEVEVVQTDLHPIILASRGTDPSWPHVIIYGHYDVQPADPLNLWESEAFEPEQRGDRLYGRGTADNKGPLMTHIAAVGKLLEAEPDLPLRITFMIEGEEEMGSPSFPKFLEQYSERLKQADLVFLSDTGIPSEDQVVITCGLRGLVLFDIEVTTAKSDLHSGLHGGVLRNPIQALTEVCASLHGPDGRVNVPGFYDDVLDVEPWEKDELVKYGTDTEAYRKFLGIPAFYTAEGFTPFEAVRFMPTLDFNGIGGGYQGEGSKTVIPSKAMAKVSCRLVANQDPKKIRQLVYAAIRERAPKDVTLRLIDQHEGTPYVVVPPDRSNTPADQSPVLADAFRAADTAIADVFGKPPLYLREGGSVPIIADIKRVLGLDSVMFGLFLPEDNLHAPNESFHLGVMERGMKVSEQVLRKLAGR